MSDALTEFGSLAIWIAAAGIVGAASGFAGGLFGIGGGIVTVPALYALFHALGVNQAVSAKSAIGTSLALIVITSLAALAAHGRSGRVDRKLLRRWIPWIAIGAACGGAASRWVSGEVMTIVFAFGAMALGLRRIWPRRHHALRSNTFATSWAPAPLGVATGLFSSLMGIGGGAVGVMAMTASGRSIHEAVATASGFGVAVAVPGALGFAVAGVGVAGLPPVSLGYVNLATLAPMALVSAIAAPNGARLAHRIHGALLSRAFGVYVIVSALAMLAHKLAA